MATRDNIKRRPARSQKSPAPLRDLAECAKRLELVLAIITIASAVLERQNADMDAEVATVLRRCAADPLSREIEQLAALISGLQS